MSDFFDPSDPDHQAEALGATDDRRISQQVAEPVVVTDDDPDAALDVDIYRGVEHSR